MTATASVTTTTLRVGSKVMVVDMCRRPGDESTVWELTKMPVGARGVKATFRNVTNPAALGLKCPLYMVRPATDDEIARFTPAEIGTAPERLRTGQLVEVQEGIVRGELAAYKAWVVTKVNAEGSANLSPLGGHDTRYLRGVPAQLLTVIDPARITIADA